MQRLINRGRLMRGIPSVDDLPEQVKNLRERTRSGISSLGLMDELPDRLRAFVDEGRGRLAASDLIDRLPDPARQQARTRIAPRRRRRPAILWALAGIFATAGLVVLWKRAIATRKAYDEEPFGFKEPHAHPAAGSGTGWPEAQRTPEHTEGPQDEREAGATVHEHDAGWVAEASTASMPEHRRSRRQGSRPEELEEPHGSSEMQNGSMPRAAVASAPHVGAAGVPEPLEQAGGLPGGSYAAHLRAGEYDNGAASLPSGVAAQGPSGISADGTPDGVSSTPVEDGAPLPPSEPPQRPPIPFTEQQAEMNARLQTHQDELYSAFPRMAPEDIVVCDGDLDHLTTILIGRTGADSVEVRARLDGILGNTPADSTNPGTHDQVERLTGHSLSS